jgi:plasmid stabilization system protein ParE
MPRVIRWTAQALEEFETEMEKLTKAAPQYAASLAAQVLRATKLLKRFPRMGRQAPDTSDPDIREKPLGRYVLMYRVRPKVIVIYAFVPAGEQARP